MDRVTIESPASDSGQLIQCNLDRQGCQNRAQMLCAWRYSSLDAEGYNAGMTLAFPKQQAGLVAERAGREVLIYTAKDGSGTVVSLNATAALIWDLCDGQHALADIEQAIRQAFSVDAERDVAADVAGTVARFRSQGLLEG